MIAVDTNILVHAHRRDSVWHAPAATRMRELAEGSAHWLIPWPCVHEFIAVVTHPRIYSPPTTIGSALDQVSAWMESPSLVIEGEGPRHWQTLRDLALTGKVAGAAVHDARVAAICLQHGVTSVWTADRDFARFPGVRTVNPLIRS